jgi:hypothetical protein
MPLGRRAVEYDELVMAGRTHNVAAQATTLGKRFASAADELLVAVARLDELMARYPLRGIQGPVGTAQDMLDLFGGDLARLAELDSAVARHLGFDRVFSSVGQVYPRSLDYDVLSALVQLAAAYRVPTLATNGVRFATPAERPLYDVLTCIHHHATLAGAGRQATTAAPLFWLRLEPFPGMLNYGVTLTRWPWGDERVVATCGAHGSDVRRA